MREEINNASTRTLINESVRLAWGVSSEYTEVEINAEAARRDAELIQLRARMAELEEFKAALVKIQEAGKRLIVEGMSDAVSCGDNYELHDGSPESIIRAVVTLAELLDEVLEAQP